jgi:uncharacterized protein YdbL (DUF1318 family)
MNNAQHSQWRADIRSNVKKALENVERYKKNGHGMLDGGAIALEALVDIGTALTTGMVSVAERVGEQTEAIMGADAEIKRLNAQLNETRAEIDYLTSATLSGLFDEDIPRLKDVCKQMRERLEFPADVDQEEEQS